VDNINSGTTPTRSISEIIAEDLKTKMVLLAGPRQCGKTTLAKKILTSLPGQILNWDIDQDRLRILKKEFEYNQDLWVFDELHKYRRWKNWLKGLYDQFQHEKKILVTGSAKLNVFKKSRDSLQGRYFFHRLHPFTVAELIENRKLSNFSAFEQFLKSPLDHKKPPKDLVTSLLKFSGFPEPFLYGSEQRASRWRYNYGQRLIQEDLRQLHDIRQVDRIELLYDRLPEVATSSITMKRLAFDLEVSFESIKSWIEMFDSLYSCFRIAPYGLAKIQAVKKQQKIFLWDWARIDIPGARLESFVALHLLRLIHWAEDVWGEKMELRYYRDQQQHEVDFLIMRKRQPLLAIEVKSSEEETDRGISYLAERVKIPYLFQLYLKGKGERGKGENLAKTKSGHKIWKIEVGRFLAGLV